MIRVKLLKNNNISIILYNVVIAPFVMFIVTLLLVIHAHTEGTTLLPSWILKVLMPFIHFADSLIFVWLPFIAFGMIVKLLFLLPNKYQLVLFISVIIADVIHSFLEKTIVSFIIHLLIGLIFYFIYFHKKTQMKYVHLPLCIWLGFFVFSL
jgi:hypothetical protein